MHIPGGILVDGRRTSAPSTHTGRRRLFFLVVGSTFFVWGLYDDVNRKLSTLQIKTYKLRGGGQRVGGILYALLEKRLTEPQNGGCYVRTVHF